MIKRITIPLNNLDTSLLLVLTDNVPKASKSLLRLGYGLAGLDLKDTTVGLSVITTYKDQQIFIAIITIKDELEDTLKILVHELFHCTQDILESKDINFKKGAANENFAYTLDYLFGQSFKKIIKYY